jgi:hypothetical protein
MRKMWESACESERVRERVRVREREREWKKNLRRREMREDFVRWCERQLLRQDCDVFHYYSILHNYNLDSIVSPQNTHNIYQHIHPYQSQNIQKTQREKKRETKECEEWERLKEWMNKDLQFETTWIATITFLFMSLHTLSKRSNPNQYKKWVASNNSQIFSHLFIDKVMYLLLPRGEIF